MNEGAALQAGAVLRGASGTKVGMRPIELGPAVAGVREMIHELDRPTAVVVPSFVGEEAAVGMTAAGANRILCC